MNTEICIEEDLNLGGKAYTTPSTELNLGARFSSYLVPYC
uniref:Uncharacterized protein n=1 Tax=Arundo donax TaxID=35708 RepID=A0A0A8Y5Y5_ARUDO